MEPLVPSNSVENLPFFVTNTIDGSLITVNVSYAVLPVVNGVTPGCPDDTYAWVDATIYQGQTCIALNGTLARGWYQVYGRVSAPPLFPKGDCGQFRIY